LAIRAGPLPVAEAAAGEVLHDSKGQAFVRAHVRDLDDVRVGQADQGADLAGEAAGELRVVEHGPAGHLDDDVAVEVAVAGPVDGAHAALAQPGRNAVTAGGEPEADPAGDVRGHVDVYPGLWARIRGPS